ncbi:cache domain-containing protein [Halarcobacter sp.]|uniref:cache domain-containing protein n=1 Tax=Halarcobacter sp. TaxID=2321133 RepID=UPI003B00DEBA
MIDKNENRILNIIKYSPIIFIFLIAIFIGYFIKVEHDQNIKSEKEQIQKDFVEQERERVEFITNKAYDFIKKKDKSKTKILKQTLKSHVTNAHSIAMSIYENNKATKSKEEITKLIKEALREIRFLDGRGYFFIYKMNGVNILNSAFPKLEGKDLWHYVDAKGTFLLQEMNKRLKEKEEVFYEWYWNKPNEGEKDFLKVGFFKKFGPYDWFIGTGEYMNDFTKEVKKEALEIVQNLKYKNDGYIFAIDNSGKIISTAHKKMIGVNIHDIYINRELSKKFKLFVDSNRSGDFFNYKIYKTIDDMHPKNKTAYMKKFDNWDWVIGSGFNMEDADSIIERRQKILENKYDKYLKNLVILSTAFLVVVLILSYFMSKYLERRFLSYKTALKNKNKNLIRAQKVAKLGDWKLDLDTKEIYWSDEVYRIFGVDKDKKVDLDFMKSLMDKECTDYFVKSINSSISKNKKHSCIYKIRKNDNGKSVWIDCKGEIDKHNNILIGTIQDITIRKKLELEKEQHEKILYQQSKMAAMGEMLNNIAHQWRQPLSTISTAATGIKLQKDMDILKDEDLTHAMDNINKSAQYLSQTIEDFRNFFNPKNSSFKEISLEESIEKSLALLEAQFKAKSITIVKNIEEIRLYTLENEFIQVLINILNNSRDALLENAIDNKLIIINSKVDNERVTIEILDSANGIDEKIITRVFEPYFTTKYKGQGTGIGLYMSQEIVTKLLKGNIIVSNKKFKYENKYYKGASFKIELSINSKK